MRRLRLKLRSLDWLVVSSLLNVMLVATLVQAARSGTVENAAAELRINSPGSIAKRLEDDAKSKEYLFQIPGSDGVFKSWNEVKEKLDRDHGLKFGISYTMFYQKTDDNFGLENDAASFDLDLSGMWTFLGRESSSPTMLGFNFFWRDKLGTDIPPQTLFTQYGSLYSGAAPFGEENPVIGELYLQKIVEKKIGFRLGQIFPITAYDFFPFKNFRTDFTDFNHVTNSTIPLPGNGFGAFVMYRPEPRLMFRLGVHDANADVQKSGFDTYDGELFTILEAGYDTGLLPRTPTGMPQGHFHLTLWHQDSRADAGIDGGWGIAGSFVQRFGRFTPFARYGYADVNADGPTPAKQMINIGLVTDEIFDQANDRIGVGYTWSDAADSSLDDQSVINAYYRIQITPQLQFGPTLEIIFNPVRHPNENQVLVWGLRARVAL